MKRIGMFLFAVALSAAALTTGSTRAEGSRCIEPACFASPGCCVNSQCDAFCNGTGLGFCQGVSGRNGGCCVCVG